MKIKRKALLLSASLITGSLLLSIAFYNSSNLPAILYGSGDDPSCEKYWSDSSYTSLYELNQMSTYSNEFTTWGTVTECYQNAAGGMSAFIQSKDAYGNVSGALLYNYGSTYLTPNTTLLEITGTPTRYYNQVRFTNTSTYEVKSTSWYTPQTNYMASSEWIDSSTGASTSDPLWQAALPYGLRKTTLRNLTIDYVATNQATGVFNDSSKQALFYFNDVSSSLKTSLYEKFNSFYGQSVDVTGYLQCFVSSSRIMELQICNPDDIVEANVDPIEVTGVTLNSTSETLNIGSSIQLTATVLPNDASNKNVDWSSSNSNIVSVENGLITALQVGTANITVTTVDGNYQDVCQVAVTNNLIHVTSVSLNQHNLNTYVGNNTNLTATVLPSTATDKSVSWHSTNTSVVTVDNGAVNAIGAGNATITVTTNDGSFTDSCSVTVEEAMLSEKTIDSNSGFSYGSYSTNFGTDSYDGISYGFYRAGNDSTYSGMIRLINSTDYYDYNALPGAFFNDTPISGIKEITVSYIASGGVTINYGVTKTRGYSQTLAPNSTSSWVTTTISCSVASCYFSIETNSSVAYINSVTIGYDSSISTNVTTTETSDYRIAPTVYSGSLVDGVSSVSVPNDISIVGDTYVVNSYKTYTYYSYDYVSAHQGSLNLASIAMTDPVDVSNYYIAFHAIPANYGYGNSVSETCASLSQVDALFGDNARSIKEYTRTDGYATAVSWNPAQGLSYPIYYEFDIALDSSYTTSNRGVGRVVMWVYGWSCYGDSNPISVYTDDHYATFGEYLNYGSFGTRFDSQTADDGYRTGYKNLLGSTLLTLA